MIRFSVIKRAKLWWTISAIAIILSVVAMVLSYRTYNAPLRPGLDFIGGTRLQLERDCSVVDCSEPIDLGVVRSLLQEQGLENSSIQRLGDRQQIISIRTKPIDVEERTELQNALNRAIGEFNPETIQIDTVGPTIGRELFTSGLLALIVSFFAIVVYLSVRFQFDYALIAILALVHDVTITLGVFALLGLVAAVEVDSLFLVAILTTIGFSVNDTVIIYDRIRENAQSHSDLPPSQIIDEAVNQTFGRSINTTLTTVLPLIAIFLFGGQTLKYFALALIVGFICGSYSSIFVASTILAWWRNLRPQNNLSGGMEKAEIADKA